MQRVLAHSFPFTLFIAFALSSSINFTIDDQFGDSVTGLAPVYLPDGAWSQGADCPSCSAVGGRVDVNRPFNGTWHAATYDIKGSHASPPSIRATFNGSAVYVYALLANIIPATTTLTNLSFSIDDRYVGSFVHDPGAVPVREAIEYNILVYSHADLLHSEHNITIEASATSSSLILFDRIVYTTEVDPILKSLLRADSPKSEPTTSSLPSSTSAPAMGSSSPSKSDIVVGAVVGVIVGITSALLTLAIAAFVVRHRRTALLSRFWKSKLFIRPPMNERPPSPPSSVRRVSSASSLLPTSAFPDSRAPSPVVSSFYQSVETTHSRAVGDSLFPAPSPLVPNTGRSGGPSPLPPRHRVDVPGPALSTTGTEHSTRLGDLTQQILSLEREMHALQGMKTKSPALQHVDGGPSLRDLWARVRRLQNGVERERRLMDEAVPRAKR